MTERVSSDNSSIHTVRATVTSAGATGRPRVEVPNEAADSLPVGEEIALVLDGDDRHAPVVRSIADSVEIRGAYDSRKLAAAAEGENRLVEWLEEVGLPVGRSVLLDEIQVGERYALREPGETTVYRVPDRPRSSLREIANSLESDRE